MPGGALKCLRECARWFPQVVPGAAPEITGSSAQEEAPATGVGLTPRLKSELGPGGRAIGVAPAGWLGTPPIAVGLDGNHYESEHRSVTLESSCVSSIPTGHSQHLKIIATLWVGGFSTRPADVHRAPPARELSASSPPSPCPGSWPPALAPRDRDRGIRSSAPPQTCASPCSSSAGSSRTPTMSVLGHLDRHRPGVHYP